MKNNMKRTRSYNQLKQTRVRIKPVKKWTAVEEKALVEFLLNNRTTEKTCAEVFYGRFCKENNFNIQWKTVRSKVKNMRHSFNRARAFVESETSGLLDYDETKILDSALKKCSYYHELEQVFGHLGSQLPIKKDNSFQSQPSNSFDFVIIESDNSTEKSDDDDLPTTSKLPEPELMEIKPDLINLSHHHNDSDFSMKCEEIGVNVKQLHLNDKIQVMELLLKEKRMELKERELSSKEKIKIHAINSRAKLKILELEMQERLAREELKLKYK